MYKLNSNMVAYFDCDDTLVKWELADADDPSAVKFELNDRVFYKIPIQVHIDELKNQAMTGTALVVWSAGGADWAECVVKTLGLEEYVDVILCKPARVFDDKDPSDYLPKRRYYVK